MALATSTAAGTVDNREGKGVSTIILTRTTSTGISVSAGAIVIVTVASNDAGGIRTVSSIIDNNGGLTWHKRASGTVNGGTYSSNIGLEVWWTFTSGAINPLAITVNMNTTTDIVVGNCYSVTGFLGTAYQTSPWDSNGVLPHVASHASSATVPGATVSTTSSNTLILGNMATDNNIGGLPNVFGAGYASCGLPQFSGNSAAVCNNSQYQVVSSVQTTAADDISPQTAPGWVFIADALAQGTASPLHQMPSMGFG